MFELQLTEDQITELLRKYKEHVRTFDNGDHLIEIGRGVYDLFCGPGWSEPTRFRLARYPSDSKISPKILQLSGPSLTQGYRIQLLKALL
jgi:hypothetical protein